MSIGFNLTHHPMGFFAKYYIPTFLKKSSKKLLMSIGSRYNIVLERRVFAKIVGTGVLDGPRYVKILSW